MLTSLDKIRTKGETHHSFWDACRMNISSLFVMHAKLIIWLARFWTNFAPKRLCRNLHRQIILTSFHVSPFMRDIYVRSKEHMKGRKIQFSMHLLELGKANSCTQVTIKWKSPDEAWKIEGVAHLFSDQQNAKSQSRSTQKLQNFKSSVAAKFFVWMNQSEPHQCIFKLFYLRCHMSHLRFRWNS